MITVLSFVVGCKEQFICWSELFLEKLSKDVS